MKDTGYWVIRTYVSGNVGEKIKYFIPGVKPKNKRQYKSDVRKQEQNFYSSERNLARLINANYKAGDVILGLDLSDEGLSVVEQRAEMLRAESFGGEKRACMRAREHIMAEDGTIPQSPDGDSSLYTSEPESERGQSHHRKSGPPPFTQGRLWGKRDGAGSLCTREPENEEEMMQAIRDAAEHELRLAIRRVKRECKKRGIEFKVLAIVSDMDGETGETVRVHCHLIVTKEVAEIFRDKWHLGGTFTEPMRKQEDYTEIAHYFISQVRKIPDSKKYISSRNLVRPKPVDRAVTSGAEVRVPKGCKLLFRSEYNEHRPQYIRYYIFDNPSAAGAEPLPCVKGGCEETVMIE